MFFILFACWFSTFHILVHCKPAKGILEATGEDFSEKFNSFDKSLWIKSDGSLKCQAKNSCAMTKRSNLLYVYFARPTKKQKNFAQFWLHDNCMDKKECCRDGLCTPFSSSELYSRRTYAYGNFIFHARPARMLRGNIVAMACWSLRKAVKDYHSGTDNQMGINFCFESNRNDTAIISARYGTTTFEENVHLPGFDLQRWVHAYRIVWKPDSISWFVNSRQVGYVTSGEHMVPDDSMYIKMFIVPHHKTKKMKGPITAAMAMYWVAYRKFRLKPEHTELYTLPKEPLHESGKIIFIVLLILVVITFIILLRWGIFRDWGQRSDLKEYILLEDDHG